MTKRKSLRRKRNGGSVSMNTEESKPVIVTGEKNKVQLDYPITIEIGDGMKEKITELEFGRIKVKHLKTLPVGFDESDDFELESLLPILAASAGVSLEVIEEIDASDLDKIVEAVRPFLPSSPQTGEK